MPWPSVSLCIYLCTSIEYILEMKFLSHKLFIWSSQINISVKFSIVVVLKYATRKAGIWEFFFFHFLVINNILNSKYSERDMILTYIFLNWGRAHIIFSLDIWTLSLQGESNLLCTLLFIYISFNILFYNMYIPQKNVEIELL